MVCRENRLPFPFLSQVWSSSKILSDQDVQLLVITSVHITQLFIKKCLFSSFMACVLKCSLEFHQKDTLIFILGWNPVAWAHFLLSPVTRYQINKREFCNKAIYLFRLSQSQNWLQSWMQASRFQSRLHQCYWSDCWNLCGDTCAALLPQPWLWAAWFWLCMSLQHRGNLHHNEAAFMKCMREWTPASPSIVTAPLWEWGLELQVEMWIQRL